jgi:uncharacterized membrane protein YtjA (UPF0391 family)
MFTLGAIFLAIAILAALFAFGMFTSPYASIFRIVFYFFIIFFVVTLAIGIYEQSFYSGYDRDPTSQSQ